MRPSMGGPLVLSLVAGSLALAAGCDSTDDGNTVVVAAIPPQGAPGPDSGSSDASTVPTNCTPGLPPAGLQNLVPGAASGMHSAMVLDDKGAPVVAHAQTIAPNETLIEVLRWDSACSKWSAPIVVDNIGSLTGNGRQIALAFDASTGAVGIAYQAILGVFGTNHHYEIHHALLAKGATKFSPIERVEEPKDNDHGPASPGLAMANGKIYLAYTEPYRICGTPNCGAVVLRTKEGGTWSAESVLPGSGDSPAYGSAQPQEVAVAVDSNGKPAVAWLSLLNEVAPRTLAVLFIRPGDAAPVPVIANTDGTVTDDPHVALAFDGTKPRVAAILNVDAFVAGDHRTEWFIASTDGTTWDKPVALPHDKNAALDSDLSLAVGPGAADGGAGARTVAVVSSSSTDDGTSAFGTPKILTATDLATFAVGGVARATYPGKARSVAAAYGPDGRLQITMRGPASAPDATKVGLLYYRAP